MIVFCLNKSSGTILEQSYEYHKSQKYIESRYLEALASPLIASYFLFRVWPPNLAKVPPKRTWCAMTTRVTCSGQNGRAVLQTAEGETGEEETVNKWEF
jgi:hypothetical protein